MVELFFDEINKEVGRLVTPVVERAIIATLNNLVFVLHPNGTAYILDTEDDRRIAISTLRQLVVEAVDDEDSRTEMLETLSKCIDTLKRHA